MIIVGVRMGLFVDGVMFSDVIGLWGVGLCLDVLCCRGVIFIV